MPWWGWISLGTVLLAAEMAVQTEFWLAVVGAAAALVGAALLVGLPMPVWLQWLAFSILSIAMAFSFRRYVANRLIPRGTGLDPELVGDHGTALSEISPGQIGKVELRGSNWRARNVGDTAIEEGDTVRVEAVAGLTLDVRS